MNTSDTPHSPAHLELYRANVGLIVLNADKKVFIGHRFGTSGDHCWQFPQGGVDEGEEIDVAALRELYEETGIRSVELIGRTKDWISYDFPPEVRNRIKLGRNFIGQKQIWFAFRFTGEDSEIDLQAHGEQEFSRWEWCDFDKVLDRVVSFKRASYRQALSELSPLF